MACNRCGARTKGRLCRDCELDDRYAVGPSGGESKDENSDALIYECSNCGGQYQNEGPGQCPHCGNYGARYAGDETSESALVTDGGRSIDDYVDLGELVEDDQIEHDDDINSLDEANQAAIEQGMTLRIQPSAPNPTQYIFAEDGNWMRQTHGHNRATTVSADKVRKTVRDAIPKNDQLGGGGVTAVKEGKR